MGAGSTERREGPTKRIVVDRAVALSAERGITGWSMRDIAAEVGVVPSVIYHYFPNKEALCDAVVGRVCESIRIPNVDLEWKPWFTALAKAIRPPLMRYCGISDRLIQGKFVAQLLPVLDAAYAKLEEAGFGERSALAYSMIANTLMHAISARNLRSPHRDGERHDLNEMLARFEPMLEESPGLRGIVDDYLEPLSRPGEEDELSEEYYRLLTASVLDGVECTLLGPSASDRRARR